MKIVKFNKMPLILAMMIVSTGQVGVSIYLPSLPLISQDLAVSQVSVQQIITLYLLGFGLSQLFYGPLSDSIGRRPVFLIGQGIYLIGTLVCFLETDNFSALVIGRALQGLGAGSASVLSRSVIRDSYHGIELTNALTYMAMLASILPICTPVIGGWIAWHLGWESVFTFVLIYLCAILIIGFIALPETLPYERKAFRFKTTLIDYWSLSRNYQVITCASYNWISYLTSLVSISILPFLLQNGLGLTTSQYGEIMIIPSIGLLVGSVLVKILSKNLLKEQLMYLASMIMLFAGVWMILSETDLFNIILGFTLLTVAQGMSFPISITLLLEPHTKQVGAVSALSGAVQMCIAGIFGGFLIDNLVTDQTSLGIFYIITGLTITIILTHSRSFNIKVNNELLVTRELQADLK